jgi:hypothetical protein
MAKLDELSLRVDSLEKRVSALERPESRESASRSKQISVKEFILLKAPSNDIQRTHAIGTYLESIRSLGSFNAEDLRRGFREARIPPPININDKVNKNISKAYFMEAGDLKDGKKAWTLTTLGEQIIERGFNEEANNG